MIIYDNTPIHDDSVVVREKIQELTQRDKKILVLGDGANHGLATAYNRCLAKANKIGARGALFLDQDSTVNAQTIILLLLAYAELRANGVKVGVIGAQPVRQDGTPYRVNKLRDLEHLQAGLCESDFVISSFSFIHTDVFFEIGNFRDDLFIDLVDTEYCYRCRNHGYLAATCTHITFQHQVGDADLKLPTGRISAISSPLRNYYQTRNIILVGRQYRRYGFIFAKLIKRFVAITLAGLAQHNLTNRWRYCLAGISDGIKGRGGIFTN